MTRRISMKMKLNVTRSVLCVVKHGYSSCFFLHLYILCLYLITANWAIEGLQRGNGWKETVSPWRNWKAWGLILLLSLKWHSYFPACWCVVPVDVRTCVLVSSVVSPCGHLPVLCVVVVVVTVYKLVSLVRLTFLCFWMQLIVDFFCVRSSNVQWHITGV